MLTKMKVWLTMDFPWYLPEPIRMWWMTKGPFRLFSKPTPEEVEQWIKEGLLDDI